MPRRWGVASLFLLLFVTPSLAIWGPAELKDLVKWSDFVVVGTLRDVKEYRREGTDYGRGWIHVTDVLWGSCQAGDRLELKWQNPVGQACPRVENARHWNKPGIWLLNRVESGAVAADYPLRFQALGKRSEIESILRTYRLRIHVDRERPGAVLTVILRNAGNETIVVPWLAKRVGGIALGPRLHLAVYDGFHARGAVVAPMPNHVIVDSTLLREVGVGAELKFETELVNVYALEQRRDYSVSVEVSGAGPAAADNFWVQQ